VNSPGDKALKCLYFLHKLILLGEDFEIIAFDHLELDQMREKYYFLLINILSENDINDKKIKFKPQVFSL
jgi:hypothetical protein